MSTFRVLAPLFLALAAVLAAACSGGSSLEDFWHTDLERASAVALESGRPMLIVFR